MHVIHQHNPPLVVVCCTLLLHSAPGFLLDARSQVPIANLSTTHVHHLPMGQTRKEEEFNLFGRLEGPEPSVRRQLFRENRETTSSLARLAKQLVVSRDS